ncbi:MAG: Holliday junction ATP-dependent DNA helicase RuvA [Chlamydiales bacterium]|nr:Holliday junction ATP-dependent DNA helicase RuvA [Chlamydiales bacterium]MCH9635722.1 Holliday junction ATP-dependent DNA helicase RuvA [Chlamydiales bacterium]MCH9704164.1 Holliday junction branch migration protein RuvA [Chlamydiota bacterium]
MYEYIKGTLIESADDYAVVDVNGVGYRLLVPRVLPRIGKTVLLYTSFVVREQSQTLFGFVERGDRQQFELLITLSGVGPKTALNLVGHIEDLGSVVEMGNSAALAKVPGIGKKTAERLIVELKGRVKVGSNLGSPKMQDALTALLNLGYSPQAAEQAVKKAAEEVKDPNDLSQLITSALKY